MKIIPLLILLTLPVLTWAASDDETSRLEIAALCQAMPYRCPTGALQATQKNFVTQEAPSPPAKPAVPRPVKRSTPQPAKPSPPLTATGSTPLTPPETRDAAGWPIATTAVESLVYECARASGVNPNGKMTMKQVRDTTNCIDLIRLGIAKSK